MVTNNVTTQPHITNPEARKLRINPFERILAFGSRGGISILFLSAGHTHIASAGRMSVQRLIQSIKIAVSACGIKNTIEAETVTSSPIFEENIYHINFLRFW